MKFGVVVFPGTSGDEDMIYVLEKVMNQQVVKLWHESADLNTFTPNDCIILPGGFSYGDYIRPGALAKFSPLLEKIQNFARQGGYVFGIGNGFQVLCEMALLPGVLLKNLSNRFVCKNIHLKTITSNSPATAAISPEEVLYLPIAHQYGRYYVDQTTLQGMISNDQILFKYCDKFGQVNEQSNPNGSVANIAGICNLGRNVFALMPHPERAAEAILHNEDGRFLFESLFRTAKTDVINQ